MQNKGSMFQEFKESRNLGRTLSVEGKMKVTDGLIKHHADGVRVYRNPSLNETLPLPLEETKGYRMVESNRNNRWIHAKMGDMAANRLNLQAQRHQERDQLEALRNQQLLDRQKLQQDKEDEMKRIREEREDEERKKEGEKRQEQEQVEKNAQNDLRQRLIKMNKTEETHEHLSTAVMDLKIKEQETAIKKVTERAARYSDNLAHVTENYIALNKEFEIYKRSTLYVSTGYEQEIKKHVGYQALLKII